jgi:hypothetical protein
MKLWKTGPEWLQVIGQTSGFIESRHGKLIASEEPEFFLTLWRHR